MKIFGVPVLGRVETGTCQTAIVEFHQVQSEFKGMCPINVQTNSLDAPTLTGSTVFEAFFYISFLRKRYLMLSGRAKW